MVPAPAPPWRALCLCICVPAWLLSGCATTPAPEAQRIKSLDITGTRELGEDEIKEKILTTEPAWPWDVEYFDPNAWQADLRRIERFYGTQGYYQAQVVEETITPVGDDAVRLEVRVDEGQPTRLAEVRIEGLDSLTPAQRESLLVGFPLKEGEIFKEEAWTQVKPMFRQRLREMGFADAAVGGEVQVDVDTRSAHARITVTPGQRYRFGDIFVATDVNPKVPPKWIIQEARTAIQQGDWYSETALAEAQQRVFKMGVFGGVKVNRSATDPQTGTVPIVIDVREAPFRTVRAGGGVGIDQSRTEMRARLEYANRNFLGGLRQFSTQLRVGYAWLPSIVDVFLQNNAVSRVSEPVANLTTEFTQPRLFGPLWRGFVSAQAEARPEQAYSVLGGQGKLGLSWTPHPSLIANSSYNLELYHFTRGVAQFGERSPQLAFGCADDPCVLSFMEIQLEWDRRMRRTIGGVRPDPVNPAEGHYFGISLQYGGGPLGGSFTYGRILPEFRYYHSVLADQRLTFAFRVRAGTLISGEESPIVARFFSGGGTSMRGYNNRRLSPLLLVPPDERRDGTNCAPDAPATDPCRVIAPIGRRQGEAVPIGGERLFEASIEARYRLNEDFILALYFDSGFNNRGDRLGSDITLQNSPSYFQRSLQYAVGAGMRYVTLVGPIRVDLAYRLPWGTPPRVYELPGTQLLPPPGGGCFGLGEQQRGATVNPEGRCALHISIGEAF